MIEIPASTVGVSSSPDRAFLAGGPLESPIISDSVNNVDIVPTVGKIWVKFHYVYQICFLHCESKY